MHRNVVLAAFVISVSVDSFSFHLCRHPHLRKHNGRSTFFTTIRTESPRKPTFLFDKTLEDLAKEWAAINRGESIPSPSAPSPAPYTPPSPVVAPPAPKQEEGDTSFRTNAGQTTVTPVPVASPQAFENIVPTPKAVRPPPPPASYQPPPVPPMNSQSTDQSTQPKSTPSQDSSVEAVRSIASQTERKRITAKKSSMGIIASAIITLLLITAGPPLQEQLREKGSYLNNNVSKVSATKSSTTITNTSPSLKQLDPKRSTNTLKSFRSIVHPETPQLSRDKPKIVPKTTDKPTGNVNKPVTKDDASMSSPNLAQSSTNPAAVQSTVPKEVPKVETKSSLTDKAEKATVTTPTTSPEDAKKADSLMTPVPSPAIVAAPKESATPPPMPAATRKATETSSASVTEATKQNEKSRSEVDLSVEPLPQAAEALSNAEKYVVQPRPVIVDTEITFEDIMKNKK